MYICKLQATKLNLLKSVEIENSNGDILTCPPPFKSETQYVCDFANWEEIIS